MSEQPLSLRRSLKILRRHLTTVGLIGMLGLLAGAGYTALNPPLYMSNALVALPTSTRSVTAQVVIASSNPVLARALPSVDLNMSLQTLRSRVQVMSLNPYLLSISGEGRTAVQAERTAKAVADSYVDFVSSPNSRGGPMQARVLDGSTTPTRTRVSIQMLVTACIGALLGSLIGAIGMLAIGRNDRRLWERDHIADAIGVPVLASLRVLHPTNAASWTRLLEDYEPGVADAWQLRNALHHLRLADVPSADVNIRRSSLTVLSLPSDQRALALGPQLAVYAASIGVATALVIDPQHGRNTMTTLRTAVVAAPSSLRGSGMLQVIVTDHEKIYRQPDAMLTVLVALVDGEVSHVSDTMRTSAMVLGVSAGAATAEQLARVAASTAAEGRSIAGILVADPDHNDQTTGRLPQLARPARRKMPTRMTGIAAGRLACEQP